MRQPKGVLLPPVAARRPRRGDLYRALRTAVLDGALSAGDRLPSTRQAAADYGVSRGVMEEVFTQLSEEGFFQRGVGRGTFVASQVARLDIKTMQRHRSPTSKPSRRGATVAANAACREPQAPLPFNAGIADTTEFPWKIWCRLQVRAARELGRSALGFADPRGLPNLCQAVARYLAQFRGIRCTARQVMIFNSAQQALNTLAVLLLDHGDAVWVEDPCYLGARAAFELAGAVAVPVPVDDDGMKVAVGVQRAPRARLAYVTPPHQYPTGVALSLERRIELLQWAVRRNSWIIEDDYDGEFRYAGQPLASLCSLDPDARVFYLGTLNKSMFVSLRLAYVVVPEEFVEPLANIRTQIDGFTPAQTQMAMSLFMEEGYFSSHLRHMRTVYAAKRKALIDALAPLQALAWSWSDNPAGMHLLLRHPNADYVRAVAASSTLDVALLSRYRAAPVRNHDDGLFLRFGALTLERIQQGSQQLLSVATRLHRPRTNPSRRRG